MSLKLKEFMSFDVESLLHSASFLNSLIVPRPVAFVTTVNEEGVVNAAPFSYFSIACTDPLMVSIVVEKRAGKRKDTSENIFLKKEFVVNICSVELAEAVHMAARDYPRGVSEIELTNLSLLPSESISIPRVAEAPVHLECAFFQVIELGKGPTELILGKILKVHVNKKILNHEGRVDVKKLNPLARVSGATYAHLSDYFSL